MRKAYSRDVRHVSRKGLREHLFLLLIFSFWQEVVYNSLG